MRIVVSLLLLWGLLLSAGCQANPVGVEAPPEIPPSPVAEPTSTPMPVSPPQGDPQMTPSPTIPANAGLQSLIDKAMADLAQRLSIPATQIKLVEAAPVVWPDSSQGCPQPGMRYKQVPEDGALIILQVQGIIYDYHNGGTRGLFLCEKINKDPYTPPKLDISDLTPPSPSTLDNTIPPDEDQ